MRAKTGDHADIDAATKSALAKIDAMLDFKKQELLPKSFFDWYGGKGPWARH